MHMHCCQPFLLSLYIGMQLTVILGVGKGVLYREVSLFRGVLYSQCNIFQVFPPCPAPLSLSLSDSREREFVLIATGATISSESVSAAHLNPANTLQVSSSSSPSHTLPGSATSLQRNSLSKE